MNSKEDMTGHHLEEDNNIQKEHNWDTMPDLITKTNGEKYY